MAVIRDIQNPVLIGEFKTNFKKTVIKNANYTSAQRSFQTKLDTKDKWTKMSFPTFLVRRFSHAKKKHSPSEN